MERILLCGNERISELRGGSSSKGDQPKWRGGDTWYKADHMGYEGAAEVVVSTLLEKSNVTNFVKYRPVQIQSEDRLFTGCASLNFRGADEMLVTFERLHRSYTGRSLAMELGQIFPAEDKIRYVVQFVEEKTGLMDVGAYLTLLLEVDAFFLNEDRHTNNLAVIRNEESRKFSFCPVFDNGLALLADTQVDYPLDGEIYQMIARVKGKPFKEDFLEQMEAAEALYGAQLRFTFTKCDVETVLSKVRPYYGDSICQRIQTVIFEQMRKYQFFF